MKKMPVSEENNSNIATQELKYISYQNIQKQSSRGVRKKKRSENMQQIYKRTPMPKCDFNKVAQQLY